jgi:hypothetical protein
MPDARIREGRMRFFDHLPRRDYEEAWGSSGGLLDVDGLV